MASSGKYCGDVPFGNGMRLPIQDHLPLTGNEYFYLDRQSKITAGVGRVCASRPL